MSSNKKALMLDAGFAAMPLLMALKHSGYETAVCSGKPQDPGHQLAAHSFCLNYANVQDVLTLAKSLNITSLLPGVTDVSYLTGASVAEAMGLRGFDRPDVAEIIFKKDVFRQWAQKKGYPVPVAVSCPEEAAQLPLPLMIKPVDSYSGLGISLVTEREHISAAWRDACAASSCGQALIERWIAGDLHSHSAFIVNGKVAVEYFVDEFCTVYPWQVNSSSLSLNLPASIKDLVSDCIQALVDELGLCDGLLHTQFISDGKSFSLIEMTRRCPGDLYNQLIEYSTDTPYSLWFTHAFTGTPFTPASRRPEHVRLLARHTVSVDQEQTFTSVSFAALPANILSFLPLKKTGERIQRAPHDRAALIFAEFHQRDELARFTPQLKDFFTLGKY